MTKNNRMGRPKNTTPPFKGTLLKSITIYYNVTRMIQFINAPRQNIQLSLPLIVKNNKNNNKRIHEH